MKTILVPSDFSKNATVALRYAIQLCKVMKTDLVVFHCAHVSPYIIAAVSASEIEMKQLIEDDEIYKMEKLLVQVKMAYKFLGIKKVPATTKMVVDSNPLVVDNILDVAAKYHADLIVMGTHGATGLNRYFFGSNTANLISRSGLPVLAIPEKYQYKEIKNFVFSSDLENPEKELNELIPFAKALNSTIDILYLDYGLDIRQEHVKNAESIIRKNNYKKIKLVKQSATIEFSLISQLKKYLSKHKYQWLVMFTKDRNFWDKLLFGGKTEYMAYSLKIPLLSFRKRG